MERKKSVEDVCRGLWSIAQDGTLDEVIVTMQKLKYENDDRVADISTYQSKFNANPKPKTKPKPKPKPKLKSQELKITQYSPSKQKHQQPKPKPRPRTKACTFVDKRNGKTCKYGPDETAANCQSGYDFCSTHVKSLRRRGKIEKAKKEDDDVEERSDQDIEVHEQYDPERFRELNNTKKRNKVEEDEFKNLLIIRSKQIGQMV